MQETPVLFLGREDPLEKGKATHSSILPWRVAGTEEPGGLQSIGLERVECDLVCPTNTFIISFPVVAAATAVLLLLLLLLLNL